MYYFSKKKLDKKSTKTTGSIQFTYLIIVLYSLILRLIRSLLVTPVSYKINPRSTLQSYKLQQIFFILRIQLNHPINSLQMKN